MSFFIWFEYSRETHTHTRKHGENNLSLCYILYRIKDSQIDSLKKVVCCDGKKERMNEKVVCHFVSHQRERGAKEKKSNANFTLKSTNLYTHFEWESCAHERKEYSAIEKYTQASSKQESKQNNKKPHIFILRNSIHGLKMYLKHQIFETWLTKLPGVKLYHYYWLFLITNTTNSWANHQEKDEEEKKRQQWGHPYSTLSREETTSIAQHSGRREIFKWLVLQAIIPLTSPRLFGHIRLCTTDACRERERETKKKTKWLMTNLNKNLYFIWTYGQIHTVHRTYKSWNLKWK